MAAWFLAASVVCLFFSAKAEAQDLSFEQPVELKQVGVVAVEKQEDFAQSYKSRRSAHGALFSVNMEKFYPVDYRSQFNDSYIEDIIQENRINLVVIELGYKYNLGFAAISALGVFAQGSRDGAFGGAQRTLKISKQGLSANIAIDGVFKEPWIVPYAQVGAHQFNISEANVSTSRAATAGVALNYKYGLLFQLDWIENSIDKSGKTDRLRSSGLENTFIDLYFSEHLASGGAIDPSNPAANGDPNLRSRGEMGVGLKMEF